MSTLSPLAVGESEDGAVHVTVERSEHHTLTEVDEVNLTVDAAG